MNENRNFQFCVLNESEYRLFLNRHKYKTFLQTIEMARVREELGFSFIILGVKENDNIVAASMFGYRKYHFNRNEFYAPRGLLVDYRDIELFKFYIKSLKKYLKKMNGYLLKIDPFIIDQTRDIDGNIITNGENNLDIVNTLLNCGFIKSLNNYQQFNKSFSLDLNTSKEDIYSHFHSLTKRMIKKSQENSITIVEADYNKLEYIIDLLNETGENKNFKTRDINYFKSLYRYFYDSGLIKFLLAEININDYLNSHKAKILESKNKLKTCKNESKTKEINQIIKKEEENIELIKKLNTTNNKAYLSAGVFITYGDELVYLFGGNKRQYMSFGSSYLMQWTMIQYAIDNNYKKYNFYGINSIDKNDGVYNFKRGFNGYVESLIGDYDLPLSYHYYLFKIIKLFIKK